MSEVVTNGKNGIVYRVGDIDDFIHQFVNIIDNLTEYKLFGKAARKTVFESYTWEKARSKLANIYEKTLTYS